MSAPVIEAPSTEAVPFSLQHLDFKPRCSCLEVGNTGEWERNCPRDAQLAFRKTCCGNVVLTCKPCFESVTHWTCVDCDHDFPRGRDMIGEVIPL